MWQPGDWRELRTRVKAARAVVTTTQGLAETLARGGRKAARFFARFGISEVLFQRGVSPSVPRPEGDATDGVGTQLSGAPDVTPNPG